MSNAEVARKTTMVRESIIAFGARVRTLSRMNTLVYSELAACYTSIIAFVARKWTLTGMKTLVNN